MRILVYLSMTLDSIWVISMHFLTYLQLASVREWSTVHEYNITYGFISITLRVPNNSILWKFNFSPQWCAEIRHWELHGSKNWRYFQANDQYVLCCLVDLISKCITKAIINHNITIKSLQYVLLEQLGSCDIFFLNGAQDGLFPKFYFRTTSAIRWIDWLQWDTQYGQSVVWERTRHSHWTGKN